MAATQMPKHTLGYLKNMEKLIDFCLLMDELKKVSVLDKLGGDVEKGQKLIPDRRVN